MPSACLEMLWEHIQPLNPHLAHTMTTSLGDHHTVPALPVRRHKNYGAGDAPATLGFERDDCNRDFQAVIGRGAAPIEEPVNKGWGIRTAYFKGLGAIKCEIEEPIANV